MNSDFLDRWCIITKTNVVIGNIGNLKLNTPTQKIKEEQSIAYLRI